VLAKSGIDPTRSSDLGKPRGLPRPRNGKRDNLQTIRGLGQLDETALNNLGIFHLDQIVEWDQRAILWLENHAFARGRRGREDWQGQARALIGDASDIRVTR
jgi:NADH-quinone oxidoreductase subunit E